MPGTSLFFLDKATLFIYSEGYGPLYEYRGTKGGDVETRTIESTSEADEANGFEWRGKSYLLPKISNICRPPGVLLGKEPRWEEFQAGGGLVLAMSKKNGIWKFALTVIRDQAEPKDYLYEEIDLDRVANQRTSCENALSSKPDIVH